MLLAEGLGALRIALNSIVHNIDEPLATRDTLDEQNKHVESRANLRLDLCPI